METILLRTKYILCTFACMLCLILSSCDNNETYHQFGHIENSSWSKNDTLKFRVDTASVSPEFTYDIQIETVNNTQFPYQNLWLFVRSNIEGAKTFRQDTLQITLADMYGKWSGSGFGSYYQNAIVFRKRIVFPQKRSYTFQIIQGMRDEPLLGIEKVGVKISRSE